MTYFERNGAYFRRHSSILGAPVNEVWWPNTGWVPYRSAKGAQVESHSRCHTRTESVIALCPTISPHLAPFAAGVRLTPAADGSE
jgi:hypothetical protein